MQVRSLLAPPNFKNMIEIKDKSGYVGRYDETFKEGDLITMYAKGIFSFVNYKHRYDEDHKEDVPLVFGKRVFTAEGKPIKSKKAEGCDAAYCRRAENYIAQRLEEIELEKSRLTEILKLI